MTPELPFELGRYRLTERIGAGAMGVVYKGEDPLIGRPVAVKVVRTDLLEQAARSDYHERFRREVKSAGCCIHPGIVTVFDYAEKDGNPYIVMEYVEGEPLQRFMGQAPLPVEEAVGMTLQILEALQHAHARGVVHRDIKPSNIIVAFGSRLKITDFGIARMNWEGMTNAGLLLGTPNYMSPERARGEKADLRADLFAAGLVLYRMVTGALPYGDAETAAVLHKVAGPDPIDLRELDARAPSLTAVMAVALAKSQEHRFQSAEAFADALRRIAIDRSLNEIWPLTPQEAAASPGGRLAALRADGAWPADLIGPLQAALADAIGPIARFLLPRVVGACQDGEALVDGLARLIDSRAMRDRFVHRARAILLQKLAGPTANAPAPPRQAPPQAAPAIPPEALAAAPALLARFIGPIAQLLVRRSSLEAGSLSEFGVRLAAHIARPDDRAAFRQAFAAEIMVLQKPP